MKFSVAKVALAVGLAAIISGCSSSSVENITHSGGLNVEVPEANLAFNQLDTAKVCCTQFSEFKYQPLSLKDSYTVLIDGSYPAYQFETGKSYVAAFALPPSDATFHIELDSKATEAVFAPAVMTLNANFQPVRYFAPEQFSYSPARMLSSDGLQAKFTIERSYYANQNLETYLLVFTTDDALKGETELLHPAKAFAIANNTVPPDVPNPMAKHSPQGVVTLRIGQGAARASSDPIDALFGEWIEDSGDNGVATGVLVGTSPTGVAPPQNTAVVHANRTVSPAIAAVPATVQSATRSPERSPTPGVVPGSQMLSETETLYNGLIEKAVSEREIDKAMRLVEEAERAGSASARAVFVEAVRNLK